MTAPIAKVPTDPAAMVHRRQFLQMMIGAGLLAGSSGAFSGAGSARPADLITRALPGNGGHVAAVGMGTYRTFNVSPDDPEAMDRLANVLEVFYQGGGRVVDSSPMYGQAEAVLGQVADALGVTDDLFLATKVWTSGATAGRRQMAQSLQRLGVERLELMQVHNLLDFRTHLDTLLELKEQGRFRYIGITHYRQSSHDELAALVERYPLDFVQCNFNVLERNARERLFPLCREKGVGVLVNEPFEQGRLFALTRDRPLPRWATEIAASSWAQVFLKYIISYPAVTAAIPATGDPDHAAENIAAARGPLPDAAMRARIEAELA